MDKKKAYEFGRDSQINGENNNNCLLSIVCSREFFIEWERGKNDVKYGQSTTAPIQKPKKTE